MNRVQNGESFLFIVGRLRPAPGLTHRFCPRRCLNEPMELPPLHRMEERDGERRDIGCPSPRFSLHSCVVGRGRKTCSKTIVLPGSEVGCRVDSSGLARGDNKFSNWDMHFISHTATEQVIRSNEQFVFLAGLLLPRYVVGLLLRVGTSRCDVPGPCRAGTISVVGCFAKALHRCTRRWTSQRDDPTNHLRHNSRRQQRLALCLGTSGKIRRGLQAGLELPPALARFLG